MSKIWESIKTLITDPSLPFERSINKKKLRTMPAEQAIELAIEASRRTGNTGWLDLARERCGLNGVVTIEKIAKACHENHSLVNISFGDQPRCPWDSIPPEKMYQVYARHNNIRRLIKNPLIPPSVLHEEWMKQAKQFISEHPDFKEFGMLPEKQRKKTEIFQMMALSLISCLKTEEKQAAYLACLE